MLKLVIKDAQPLIFIPLQAMYSGDTYYVCTVSRCLFRCPVRTWTSPSHMQPQRHHMTTVLSH